MSLRARLLVGMGVVALVLALAGVVITGLTERHLVDQIDAQLAATDSAVRDDWRPDHPDRSGHGPDDAPEPPSVLYTAVLVGDRLEVLYEPNLGADDGAAPDLDAATVAAAADGEAFTVAGLDGDGRYRVLVEGDGDDVVVTALPLGGVDDTVQRLIAVEALVTAGVLGLLGIVTWWVIRLGVQPVKAMTRTASAIAGGDLTQRVPEGRPGTEAGELGDALNRMLATIEAAFEERTTSEERLRRFVADASHELRTPVTTIRGYAELYRVGALDEPAELEQAMRRTEQEAIRMGDLVEDLLLLARLDEGRPLDTRPVDLAAVALDATRDARAVAPTRTVTGVAPATVPVLGDESRLRQVVANLVGNALVHTPPDAVIEIRARTVGLEAVVEVADTGPGMEPDVAKRVFERFFRADPSRSRHRGGTGLGLSIVDAAVHAHGGRIELDTAPGTGTTVRILLPLRT